MSNFSLILKTNEPRNALEAYKLSTYGSKGSQLTTCNRFASITADFEKIDNRHYFEKLAVARDRHFIMRVSVQWLWILCVEPVQGTLKLFHKQFQPLK